VEEVLVSIAVGGVGIIWEEVGEERAYDVLRGFVGFFVGFVLEIRCWSTWDRIRVSWKDLRHDWSIVQFVSVRGNSTRIGVGALDDWKVNWPPGLLSMLIIESI
jgi:hypothetical protein